MSVPTEQQRIEQAQGGDRCALEELLLDSYEPLTQHLARQFSAAEQSVVGIDDLIQKTFTQAFRSIGSFQYRGEGSLHAWLRAIADNRLRDELRAARRQKRGGARQRVYHFIAGESGFVDDLVETFAAGVDSPSRAVAREEAIRAIQLAIAALPDGQRAAISNHYLDGRTIQETAELMERTPAAVRGLLDRGKKSLHESLERASRYLSRK